MKVKTFHALTMQDAMRAIKEELGPDAIILSAKEVREGGRVVQAFNRPVLEVMAASDQDVQRFLSGGRQSVNDGAAPGRPSDEGIGFRVVRADFSTDAARDAEAERLRRRHRLVGQRPASSKPLECTVKPNRPRHSAPS